MSTEEPILTPNEQAPLPILCAMGLLVTLLVPIALILAAMRLMMTSTFLHIEYNMPGFPADPYGFTKQERLYWSQIALDYLLNEAGIEFLEDLRFADGTPVYNQRELLHMVDVKRAVKAALSVWYLSLVGLILLGVWAWQGGWWRLYRRGLQLGGWLTVILVGSIILLVLLSFNVFFVAFHNVFFEPGTWMFDYRDTLIRLFPERFWQDVFIWVGSLAAIAGLGLGLGLHAKAKE